MKISNFPKWLLIISAWSLTTNTVTAQDVSQATESHTDSVASPNFKPAFIAFLKDDIQNAAEWKEIDTTNIHFSDYDCALNSIFYSATLGNIGHSHRVLDYQLEPFGYKLKKIPLPHYLFTKQNISIFNTSSPYTQISYIAGSNRHHLLKGTHAQQINNISLGVTFNVINSQGAYQQQRSSVAGASTYLSYKNSKNSYRIIFSYFFNQINNLENGGILNDSLFVNNIEPFRGGMPISLFKARNEFVQNSFQLSQTYTPFGKKDSIKQNSNQWIILSHSLSYDKQKWIFSQDELDSIQSATALINPFYTKDSIASEWIENKLEWRTQLHIPIGKRKINFSSAFGVHHSLFNVGDSISNENNNYFGIHGRASFISDSVWKLKYDGEQIIGGWSSGAYSHHFNFSMLLFQQHNVQLDLLIRSNQQHYFYNNFHGNFHQWNYNDSRINEKKIGISYFYRKISLGFDIFQISNFVYLNTLLQPEVNPDNIKIFRLWSEININYRILFSQTKLNYHKNSANDIMMFPDFVVRQKLYTVFPLFKKAMLANTGIEGIYIPEYHGAYYIPNLFDFYVNKTQSIGNFFYVNLFVGFKVKRFNFMVKMLNAPQGLLPYDYFSSPSYPLTDRQFRLGVSWRFYD